MEHGSIPAPGMHLERGISWKEQCSINGRGVIGSGRWINLPVAWIPPGPSDRERTRSPRSGGSAKPSQGCSHRCCLPWDAAAPWGLGQRSLTEHLPLWKAGFGRNLEGMCCLWYWENGDLGNKPHQPCGYPWYRSQLHRSRGGMENFLSKPQKVKEEQGKPSRSPDKTVVSSSKLGELGMEWVVGIRIPKCFG